MTIGLRDIYGVSADDLLPDGGTTGQVLAKQSATDGDVDWEDPESGPISEFDTSVTYNTDDIVLRNGNLYRATQFASATAGSWVSNVWEQITLPAGGTTGQVLAKQSATGGDADWIDPPSSGGLQTVDMTGQAAVTLDCSQYDTFELNSMDTAATITLDNFDAGMTIVIIFENAAVGVTWADTILWPRNAPAFSPDTDTVVLTKVSTKIVGSFSLGQV